MSTAAESLDKVVEKLPYQQLEKCSSSELGSQRSLLHSLHGEIGSVKRRLSTIHDATQTIAGKINDSSKSGIENAAHRIEQRCDELSDKTENKLASVKEEIRSRETLNAELRDMLVWVEEMRESADRTLDLTPAPAHVQDKIDSLKQLKEQLSNKEAHFNTISEDQRQKYLHNYALLPVELSSTIAKIRIALAALHEELKNKEAELEQARHLREDYHDELMKISENLVKIEMKLSEHPSDMNVSEKNQKTVNSELDECHVRLVNLDAVAQEIADQTSHLGSKASLNAAVSAVNDHYVRVQEMADAQVQLTNQASVYIDGLDEMADFLSEWVGKAKNAIAGPLSVLDSKDARRQLRENKNLRDQLRRLKDEILRKRERLPAALPPASTAIFHQKIDRMLEDCSLVEAKIRSREEELANAVSVATEMEEEVASIAKAVADLRASSSAPDDKISILDQIEKKRRILRRLQLWREKLEEVKNNHPYQLSPSPSPRKRYEAEDKPYDVNVDVPKLALHTLREPVHAVKVADDLDSQIDDVEMEVTAQLLELEALARDHDAYEDEISHLDAQLKEAKRKLDDLTSARKPGSSRTSTPRDAREQLDQYRKLTDDVEKYERQIEELRKRAQDQEQKYDDNDDDSVDGGWRQQSPRSVRSIPLSDTPRAESPQTIHENITPNTANRLRDSSSDFDSKMLAATANVPISPKRDGSAYRHYVSPGSSSTRLQLVDLLDDQLNRESQGSSPCYSPQALTSSKSNISTCSTNSLLSPRLAEIGLVKSSPEPSPHVMPVLDEDTREFITPQPVASSTPYLPRRSKSSSKSPEEKVAKLDQSWSKLKDELGEQAQSLLSTLKDHDDLQSEIQAATSKLDDFQDRLDDSDHVTSLQTMLANTQELLDDINLFIPKLENIERRVRFLAKNDTAREAFNATVSVLYDRWDTVRMQTTSKQNAVEIKILEEEQYKRMVQAYKAELQQVTEWMEEAKHQHDKTPSLSDTSVTRPSSAGSSSVASSNMTTLHLQLKKCRNTVVDIERKLKLLSELSGKSVRRRTLSMTSQSSNDDSARSSSTVTSSNVANSLHSLDIMASRIRRPSTASGLPCLKELLCERSSMLTIPDEDGQELLQKLDEVKGDLMQLQKMTKNREKNLQHALDTKDKSEEETPQNIDNWLDSVQSEVETPTALQRRLSSDLQMHQEDLEDVARAGGRSRSVSQDSFRPPSSLSTVDEVDSDLKWRKLRENLERKMKDSEELSHLSLTQKTYMTLGFAQDLGENTSVHQIMDNLRELKIKWNTMEGGSACRVIDQQSQDQFKILSDWLSFVEFNILLPDWSKEVDAQILNQADDVKKCLEELKKVCKVLTGSNVLVDNKSDVHRSLCSLTNRIRSVKKQVDEYKVETQRRKDDWRNIQVELKVGISKLTSIEKSVDELPASEKRMETLAKYKDEINKLNLERLTSQANQFANGGFPQHTCDSQQLDEMRRNLLRKIQRLICECESQHRMHIFTAKIVQDFEDVLETLSLKNDTECQSSNDLDDLKGKLTSCKNLLQAASQQRQIAQESLKHFPHPFAEDDTLKLQNLMERHEDVEKSLKQNLGLIDSQITELENLECEVNLIISDVDDAEISFLELEDYQLDADDVKKIKLLQGFGARLAEDREALQEACKQNKNESGKPLSLDLESRINESSGKCLIVSTKVNSEIQWLKRLQQSLEKFEPLFEQLSTWMEKSFPRLSEMFNFLERIGWKISLDKMTSFNLEFHRACMTKDVVVKLAEELNRTLKPSSVECFNRRVEKLKQYWVSLEAERDEVYRKVIKKQKKDLSTSDLATLMSEWIFMVNTALDREKLAGYDVIGTEAIKNQLVIYKSYQAEIAFRQETVEFLQKHETSEVKFEVETIVRQFALLIIRLNETVTQAESEYEKWEAHENEISALQSWMDEHLQMQNDEISIKLGSPLETKAKLSEKFKFEAKLKSKYHQIVKLEKNYKNLVFDKNADFKRASPVPGLGSSSLGELHQTWTILEHSLVCLKKELNKSLNLWNRYQSAESIAFNYIKTAESALMDDESMFSEMDRKIAKLEATQQNLQGQNLQIQLLAVEADCIITRCHDNAAAATKQRLAALESRWNDVTSRLSSRITQHKATQQTMNKFNEEFAFTEARMESIKATCEEIGSMKTIINDPNATLIKAENLLENAVALAKQFEELEKVQLNKSDSHHGMNIESTMRTMRLATSIDCVSREAHDTFSRVYDLAPIAEKFADKLGYLETWLTNFVFLDKVAGKERIELEGKIESCRARLQAFKAYAGTIDHVNMLSCELPLAAPHIKRLQELNLKWKESLKKTVVEFADVQHALTEVLEFEDKCENWMLFVAQSERSLVADVACSYEGLLEQARSYDLLLIESGARQQLLRSIIQSGNEQVRSGAMHQSEEISQKLSGLESQWKSVLIKARQRKSVVHSSLQVWGDYEGECRKAQCWLVDVNLEMQPHSINTLKCNLFKLEDTDEKIKRSTNEVLESSREVVGLVTGEAHSRFCREVASKQHKLNERTKAIKIQKRQILDFLMVWNDCEYGVDEVMELMRETRELLLGKIPSEHENLHGDLIKCRDREIMFEMGQVKLDRIRSWMKKIKEEMKGPDVKLLQERVTLATTLWNELLQQTTDRKKFVDSCLTEWNQFDDQYHELCDWLCGIEAKVSMATDGSINDLIGELQQTYLDDMTEKRETLMNLASKLDGPNTGSASGRKERR
uniref:nesprin-1-like isoform X2 n=1 Tax=Ciona intestinalis TaxID=7719 RepID=UPI000EF52DBB|nr:nesprin-1-like isoform X2 [Ciona intestinalis]|eukprot:XP_026689761.1 nesprin-1-like isoform X2 [Ciona intestinalis]